MTPLSSSIQNCNPRGLRIKRFIEGADRTQVPLPPECVDDYAGRCVLNEQPHTLNRDAPPRLWRCRSSSSASSRRRRAWRQPDRGR